MNQSTNTTKTSNITIVIFLLFTFVYCLISLLNHYFLRTYALDYGMFNHAVYQFSKLESNDCTICFQRINYFADHFSPITILLIPFLLIFGSYGLLIAQITFVLLGAFGFYKYTLVRSNNNYLLSQIFLALFLSFTGIFSALAFDYHNNVVAAMMIPWIFYFLEVKKFKWVALLWILVLFCKENMGLWMGFLMIGLLFVQKGKYRKTYKWQITTLVILSFSYFYFVTNYLMPALAPSVKFNTFSRYSMLGNSLYEIIFNSLEHPLEVLKIIFHESANSGSFKREFLIVSLLFGLWACILRPAYFIMLIPLIAQKFFTNDSNLWGIYGQYYIEFGPIFLIATFEFVLSAKFLSNKRIIVAAILLCVGLMVTLLKTNFAVNHSANQQARFLKGVHYRSSLNVDLIKESIKIIPNEVPVSCSSILTSRLYKRKELYMYPMVKNAEIIAIVKNGNPYPLNEEKLALNIQKLRETSSFDVLLENEEVIFFKKLEQ